MSARTRPNARANRLPIFMSFSIESLLSTLGLDGPDPGAPRLHLENDLAAEVAAHVFPHDRYVLRTKPLASDRYVAHAERVGARAEGLQHAGPPEDLGPEPRAPCPQPEHALDQQGHGALPEAGGGRPALGQQKMIHPAHSALRVPEADRDARSQDGRHL